LRNSREVKFLFTHRLLLVLPCKQPVNIPKPAFRLPHAQAEGARGCCVTRPGVYVPITNEYVILSQHAITILIFEQQRTSCTICERTGPHVPSARDLHLHTSTHGPVELLPSLSRPLLSLRSPILPFKLLVWILTRLPNPLHSPKGSRIDGPHPK
jgi:hypothetical protein